MTLRLLGIGTGDEWVFSMIAGATHEVPIFITPIGTLADVLDTIGAWG